MMKYITLLDKRIENARVSVKYRFSSDTVTICNIYVDKEKKRAYEKEYYKHHKEQRTLNCKKYYHKHIEQRRKQKRSYREKHKKLMHKIKINGCVICGYNKCDACLDFHHVNPEDKKFGVNSVSMERRNFVEELNKCILLCKNCHHEIHDKARNLFGRQ